MSSLFQLPHKGELLWGAIARFSARFPALGFRDISELVFGRRHATPNKLLPKHISAFCERLAHPYKPDADTVLRDNTVYPFVAPFLTPQASRQLREETLESESRKRIKSRYSGGIVSLPTTPLRFCPDCVKNDLATIGVGAWRCIHQVQSLKICPVHGTDLVQTAVLLMDRQYVSIENASRNIHVSPNTNSSPLQIALARNLEELQMAPQQQIGPIQIRDACRIALQKSGRKTRGRSAFEDFTNEIVRVFGREELARCHAPVAGARAKWAKPIFLHSSYVSPLYVHHCNVISTLLGISMLQLLQNAKATQRTESGPWPCLSVGFPCSGKNVIARGRTKGDDYRFSCPHCGTHYSRTAPLVSNPDGTFVFQLKRAFGVAAVAPEFKEVWCNPKSNWKSLKAQFGKPEATLGLWAAMLNLPDMPGRTLKSHRKYVASRSARITKQTNKRTSQVLDKRAQFSTYIKKNKSARYTDAPLHIRKLYNWLLYHDQNPSQSFVPYIRKNNISIETVGIAGRDSDIAAIIREGANQVQSTLKQFGTPRVSLNKVLRFFASKIYIPVASINRMPLTKTALDALAETKEQWQQRRLRQAIEFVDGSTDLPKWYLVFHRFASMPPEHIAQVRSSYLKRRSIGPGWNSKSRRSASA